MITFKGSPLVKGKHFILDNEKIEYKGKVYGTHHLFESGTTELVLTEQEALNLKQYKVLNEHSLLSEQDNSEDLYQVVTSYSDKQMKICEDTPSSKLWTSLLDSFQEEVNKLQELGLSYTTSYKPIDGNSQYLLEVIEDFLHDTQRNISDTSLPNLYVQLNNFIYNIQKLLDKEGA